MGFESGGARTALPSALYRREHRKQVQAQVMQRFRSVMLAENDVGERPVSRERSRSRQSSSGNMGVNRCACSEFTQSERGSA